MRTHRLATLAAATTITLLALGGTAFALGADDTTPPSVGSSSAATTAVARVGGGQATHVEREVEHGRVEWKVDVTRGGVRHEVRVDDATRSVVRTTPGAAPAPVVRSDDGPRHDVGDDHGGRVPGKGSDDGAGHDAGDDHGRGHDD